MLLLLLWVVEVGIFNIGNYILSKYRHLVGSSSGFVIVGYGGGDIGIIIGIIIIIGGRRGSIGIGVVVVVVVGILQLQ